MLTLTASSRAAALAYLWRQATAGNPVAKHFVTLHTEQPPAIA